MKIKAVMTIFLAATACAALLGRSRHAPPPDLRDAVGDDFNTALPVLGGGSGAFPAPAAPARAAAAGRRDYGRTAPALIDPRAGEGVRSLYASLRSQYGVKIYSGQTTKRFDAVTALAGKTPAVRAFDMKNYSPHNPWHDDWSPWDDGTVQEAIDWYNGTGGKGVVTFQWHWFSPSAGRLRTSSFYTRDTAFDVSRAVVPGSQEYTDVLRDIDAIAVQLKRLRDAGVPVLWRPLHEAGGRWFWWGAKGPAPCLRLYDLMYERLAVHHQLHNLIWVWSTPEPAWYPGNAKVDMVGYDSYPGPYIYSSQRAVFDGLYALVRGEKLIALTENGPIPDIDECLRVDARWAYFLSWSDLAESQNSPQHIRSVFAHPDVVTIESLRGGAAR